MPFILAKKIGMSQRFKDNGNVVPVTLLQAGPCVVTQVKTQDKDGYSAIQLGLGEAKNPTKARAGHTKDLKSNQHLREFRIDDAKGMERGTLINADTFKPGDLVKATGTSKGKGFQGVVRRHGFRGGPASHGHKDNLRMPGSIGATFPQHVIKGRRMAGHMGDTRISVKNLEIIDVEVDKHLIAIKGAVPGARGALILLQSV